MAVGGPGGDPLQPINDDPRGLKPTLQGL